MSRKGGLFLVGLILSIPLAAQVLTDQFGGEFDLGAAIGRGGLLVFWSDRRDAAELLDAWGEALTGSGTMAAGTKAIAVSDLRSLPFFVPRIAVINMLKRDLPSRPVLLDWKGEFAAAWSLPRSGVAVLLFGPGGVLRARETGPVSAPAAERLKVLLRAGS